MIDVPDTVIVTWKDKFGERTLAEHAQRHPASTGQRTPPAAGVYNGESATARVNQGRWIADCPNPTCTGAEYVDTMTLLFFCCECRNRLWGNQPLPVDMPTTSRTKIEAALLKRPNLPNRNWRKGETVKALTDENKRMGVA